MVEISAISLSYLISFLRKKTHQIYNAWVQGYRSGVTMVQTNKKLTKLNIKTEAQKINGNITELIEFVDGKQEYKK